MANGLYDGTLESIPGLGGYLQQQRLTQQQDLGTLQKAQAIGGIVQQQQSLADAQKVRAILTSGGDPGTVIQSLIQAGPTGIEAAKTYLGVQQAQNSLTAAKGLNMADPDSLRRAGMAKVLGGDAAGGNALLSAAKDIETRRANATALGGMQDQQTPVTSTPTFGVAPAGAQGVQTPGVADTRANIPVADPIDPDLQKLLDSMQPGQYSDAPGVVTMKKIPPAVAATLKGLGMQPDNPVTARPIAVQTAATNGGPSFTDATQGTGGIALPLMQSAQPVIAANAKMLQSQVDNITPTDAQSFNPQHIMDRVSQLQTQEGTLQNAAQRINISINKEGDANVRAGLNADGTPSTASNALSDAAIAAAAARYRIDGTLPPNMGRGAQGVMNTNRILNQAADDATAEGNTPEAQRISQIANKASSSALLQISKQEATLGAFENNALSNADLAVAASGKVDRTGVPLINRWIQAGRTEITGDPDARVFNAANSTFVSEYAKVMSGGTGASATTEGATHRAQDLLNTADTPQAYVAVVNQLKLEMANRMKGFAAEKQQLMSGMGGAAGPAPAAPPNASRPAQLPPNSLKLPGGTVLNFPSGAALQAYQAVHPELK